MEITHGSDMEFKSPGLNHRPGMIEFKFLSLGEENTKENYNLTLARQRDFYSPIHRHNFDQFRYAWKGDVTLGKTMLLKEGHFSYHPEGAYYGPQEDLPGVERIVLVLQCGGASGEGYMSYDQLRKANKELADKGTFEGGKFHSNDGRQVMDGYQALWEHISGRKLEYPKPRYDHPIMIRPENFSWRRPSGDAAGVHASGDDKAGVWEKPLGTFSERGLRAEQLWVGAGASVQVGSAKAIHLAVVVNGSGRVGSEEVKEESAIRLKPGNEAEIVGTTDMLLIHYVLPLLSKE